jgi:hypothetical protein
MVLLAALLAIFLPLGVWLAVYGYAWRQDRLRMADAKPAFEPVLPLRAELLSNPCGTRYCSYYLRFPSNSLLTDDNVEQIQSLSKLPSENDLNLIVETSSITDASLGVLMSLRTIDYLDLTKTSVSNDGLEQLSAALPDAFIQRRETE